MAAAACLAVAGCTGGIDRQPPVPAATASLRANGIHGTCASIDLTPLRIVSIDERQQRLFVVAKGAAESQLIARIHDLHACLDATDWAARWSLSIFTLASMAAYKDDPRVGPAVRNGQWANAYAAEYDAATTRLTMHPASATPRVISIADR
jgi:hypothetical protein